jgi:hypothetical protein
MTKKTTNLLGIIITILAGIYFFVMYCSQCGLDDDFATLNNEDSSVLNNTMNTETIEKSKQEFLYKN